MMASRSLIGLYRTTHPELLHKKDRGRPTEAMREEAEEKSRGYGDHMAKDYVPGAEVVEQDDNDEESDFDDSDYDDDDDDEDGEKDTSFLTLEEKKSKATLATSSRIFTDADFKRIDAAQLKKQVQPALRKNNRKRKREEIEDIEEDDAGSSNANGRQELVDLSAIEMVHKKRRHDKEARLATVLEGRKERRKFGSKKGKANENASTTNKVKAKNKNFMMLKHKLKRKAKRSFVEKAAALKKSMIRSRKFK